MRRWRHGRHFAPASTRSPPRWGAGAYASCARSASRSIATAASWSAARSRSAAVTIGHVLVDGLIEPHAATEEQLLALAGKQGSDLFSDRAARLAEAYRRRARGIAARAKA